MILRYELKQVHFQMLLYSYLVFCLQLERLKNENSLAHDDHPSESDFPGLERQLMQLHKVIHKFYKLPMSKSTCNHLTSIFSGE